MRITNSFSGKYKLVERPGESYEGVGRKKIEPDPDAQFKVLLQAFERYKDISTECGLNQSVHQNLRVGDPHKKKGKPDRYDYELQIINGQEEPPGPRWHSFYRWL